MIHTIYIEDDITDHPRTRAICERFPEAVKIPCERYGEIFNRKAQNFRLQKQRAALILARKFKNFVLEAPRSYNIGGERNFYFSHMLNCIYDCRYCFLQGMYRSANYVLFVNYEDFDAAIRAKAREFADEPTYFFSGYDCDSLALEPVTGFVQHILPLFAKLDNAWLELRTKSTQIRALTDFEALPNCVVAFSLAPEKLAKALEHKAPPLERRLDALEKLHQRGWPIGLRFDPLIYCEDYQTLYEELFQQVFERIDGQSLHSVSLGNFRLPEPFFRNMTRLYPDERLFAGPLAECNGMMSYPQHIEREMIAYCTDKLLQYIPESVFFPCTDDE